MNTHRDTTKKPGLARDIMNLGKPRITGMVLVTTLLGFSLGSSDPFPWALFGWTMLGTLLISYGIHSLNQWMERDIDGLMPRTANRPLPQNRLPDRPVLIGGIVVLIIGLVILPIFVNLLAGIIGLGVAVLYVLVYTPMKRVSQWNTVVGAIPGALPPVLGWAAVQGDVDMVVLSLFLIMFVWQYPHFMSIAWLYREDYARAKLAMISVVDPTGGSIRRQSVLWTIGLIAVSLLPYVFGVVSLFYAVGALILGLGFFAVMLSMVRTLDDLHARRALKASVIYLPLLLALLVYDANYIV